jgi:hypothetical protein
LEGVRGKIKKKNHSDREKWDDKKISNGCSRHLLGERGLFLLEKATTETKGGVGHTIHKKREAKETTT